MCKNKYIITDLVADLLHIIQLVVYIGEVTADDFVGLLLDEGVDVVKYCLFLFAH